MGLRVKVTTSGEGGTPSPLKWDFYAVRFTPKTWDRDVHTASEGYIHHYAPAQDRPMSLIIHGTTSHQALTASTHERNRLSRDVGRG